MLLHSFPTHTTTRDPTPPSPPNHTIPNHARRSHSFPSTSVVLDEPDVLTLPGEDDPIARVQAAGTSIGAGSGRSGAAPAATTAAAAAATAATAAAAADTAAAAAPSGSSAGGRPTVLDYYAAYSSGATTPSQVGAWGAAGALSTPGDPTPCTLTTCHTPIPPTPPTHPHLAAPQPHHPLAGLAGTRSSCTCRQRRALRSGGWRQAPSLLHRMPATPPPLAHRARTRSLVPPPSPQVAEHIISFLVQHDLTTRWLTAWDPKHLRTQAEASTARWAAGAPLSLLDGVPFAVKDCLDALPYPTTGGTVFMADM